MSVLTDEGGFVVPPQRALWLPHGTQHEVYYRAPVSLRTLYIEPAASAGLPAKTRIVEVSALLRSLVLEAVNLPRSAYFSEHFMIRRVSLAMMLSMAAGPLLAAPAGHYQIVDRVAAPDGGFDYL